MWSKKWGLSGEMQRRFVALFRRERTKPGDISWIVRPSARIHPPWVNMSLIFGGSNKWRYLWKYWNMGHEKTTLEIPDALMLRVKMRAVSRQQKLKDVIAQCEGEQTVRHA